MTILPPEADSTPVVTPAQPKPFMTWAIIAICGVVFVVDQLTPVVFIWGAFNPVLAVGEPWRYLSAAFLHSGAVHLLFNMFALYSVGPDLERFFGRFRYGAMYLLSAVGGSVAMQWWGLVDHASLRGACVGASGAIFGLFAAIFWLQRRLKINTWQIVILLAVNFGIGFTVPNVAWQAHLGGFLVGGMLAWFYLFGWKVRKGMATSRAAAAWRVIWPTAVVTVFLVAAAWLGSRQIFALVTSGGLI